MGDLENAVQKVNDGDVTGFKDTFNSVLKKKVEKEIDTVHGKKEEEAETDDNKTDDKDDEKNTNK